MSRSMLKKIVKIYNSKITLLNKLVCVMFSFRIFQKYYLMNTLCLDITVFKKYARNFPENQTNIFYLLYKTSPLYKKELDSYNISFKNMNMIFKMYLIHFHIFFNIKIVQK